MNTDCINSGRLCPTLISERLGVGLSKREFLHFGDKLVGELGIYFENGLGRFQSVGTHPDFRRRGICGTMVYLAAKMAMAEFDIKTLVMEADADYHVAKIYESVGFKPTEVNYSLSWWTK